MSGASQPKPCPRRRGGGARKAISHSGSESRRARTLPAPALSEQSREERRPIGFDVQMYVRTVAAAGFVFDGEDRGGRGSEGCECVAKCMTAVFVEGVRHAFAEASNGIKHDRQNVKGPVWMIYCGCVVHCECLQDCLRARRATVHAALLPKQQRLKDVKSQQRLHVNMSVSPAQWVDL